ncbi:MAG TPA: hypothetical protein VK088_09720, partial [Acidimicrobiia bacterium]|nr:hypothetical protein [Acidimicrobiia bacterium]
RLAEAAAANEAAENRVARRAESRVAAAERGRQRAEEQAREVAREVERLQAHSVGLEEEVKASQARIEVLRSRLEKERRANTASPSAPEPRGWFPSTPEEMASELDRIALAIRRPPSIRPRQPDVTPPLALPDGIRPDGRAAIEWLLGQPVRWLLDGYNVAYQLGGEADSIARRRVVAAAAQLVARSVAGTTATVVFDSSVDQASIPSARRVLTVFDESADEWILGNAGSGSVVVSSDRRVREGSETSGALGIWTEALVAWIEAGYPTG